MKTVCLIAALLFSLVFNTGSIAAPVELLTPAEARQPDQPITPPDEKLRGAGAPAIIFDSPAPGKSVSTPFPVKVRFVATGNAKILPDTLRIDVLKIVPISLLSKVKPYLSASGINVPEAQIPAGKYSVRVIISDDQGRQGMVQETWLVK